MPRIKYKITYDVVENGCLVLLKDVHFDSLFGMAYGFHKVILSSILKNKNLKYVENKEFTLLLEALKDHDHSIVVSRDEMIVLNSWIDYICKTIIKNDNIDFSDKKLKMFFKLSDSFIKETNILINKKDELRKCQNKHWGQND